MTDREPDPGRSSVRGLLAAVAAVVLIVCVTALRLAPPEPRGVDTPSDEFSAARAKAELELLLGDGAPHPVGSPAHTALRERLEARLRALGLEPLVLAATVPGRDCAARVEDVLAFLPGPETGPILALTAHYDSVHAGPGASDDGAGVATLLETARALLTGPPLRQRVLLLFTDGEEIDLLGARAFEDDSPWASDLAVVVNVEARGTTGPSLLFETGHDDAWLIDAFARSSPRPVTGSTFAFVYDRMPNGTDLSVFKEAGATGVNFAFIGGGARYHTTLDDLAHLDLGSLQQHGDNVLALVRELQTRERVPPPDGAAVDFDLFALGVARWPARYAVVLALIVMALLRRRQVLARVPSRWTWAEDLAAIPLTLVIAALGVALAVGLHFAIFGVESLTGAAATTTSFPATAWLHMAAAWTAAAVGAGGAACLCRRWLPRVDLIGGMPAAWALFGVVLAATAREVSYVFVAPAACVALLWPVTALLRPRAAAVAECLDALALPAGAALVWAPFALLLPDALGATNVAAVAAPAALIATTLAPRVVDVWRFRWRTWLAGALLAALLVGAARHVSPFTADVPRGETLRYHARPESGEAAVLLERREAGGGGVAPQWTAGGAPVIDDVPYIRGQRGRFGAPHRLEGVYDPPRFEGVTRTEIDGGVRLRGRIVSPRGAPIVMLRVRDAARLRSLALDGAEIGLDTWRRGGSRRVYTHYTVPPEGVTFSIDLDGAARLPVELYDESPGLPPAVERAYGPLRSGVPFQRADATIVSAVSDL